MYTDRLYMENCTSCRYEYRKNEPHSCKMLPFNLYLAIDIVCLFSLANYQYHWKNFHLLLYYEIQLPIYQNYYILIIQIVRYHIQASFLNEGDL